MRMKTPRKRFKLITITGNSTPVISLKEGIIICEYLSSGAKVIDQFGTVHYIKP
jgi:hypothetical protein